ncbi:MAG TPA: hypothetical protein VGY56_02380 [Verrucomicrobiae bacterium]|nr:hypothetical protein [Verrucomicrobiae bacterium]
MDDDIPIFGFGSLLIECPLDENEEQFHAFVTELLVEVYGRLPNWVEFSIGSRFERNGIFYREFLCSAGSVDSNIQLLARRPGGISRKIICRGSREGIPYCCEIQLGIENEFECDELLKVSQ